MTNLQGNVQQLEGRINNQILGVKGLRTHSTTLNCQTVPDMKFIVVIIKEEYMDWMCMRDYIVFFSANFAGLYKFIK